MLTIIKNKNPFALVKSSTDWRGEIPSSNSFEAFEKWEMGIRAGYINLHTMIFKRGYNTLRKLMAKYAPTDDGTAINKGNNPLVYANNVAAKTGLGIDDVISYIPQLHRKLGDAIMQIETGNEYHSIPSDAKQRGFELFLEYTGVSSQDAQRAGMDVSYNPMSDLKKKS